MIRGSFVLTSLRDFESGAFRRHSRRVRGGLTLFGRLYETVQPLLRPGRLASEHSPLAHPEEYKTTKVATHGSLLCLRFLGLRILGVQLLSRLRHLKAVSINKWFVVGVHCMANGLTCHNSPQVFRQSGGIWLLPLRKTRMPRPNQRFEALVRSPL